ncbi:PEP-CTERM sorting domain-containing protein [Cerasicoccus arenae]
MKHPLISTKLVLSSLGLGLLLTSAAHSFAIDYSVAASTYSQDFNSFGSTSGAWTNGVTLDGWHWINANGNLSANYNPQDGDPQGSLLLTLGTDGSSERAFGAQNGNAIQTLYFGAQILNTTGSTLDSFTLSYIGEQWRAVGNEGQDKLTFEYQIFASGATDPMLAASGWTNVAELDFNAPITTTGSSKKLDGNLPDNRLSISSTATGIAWGEGQELWLRWSDNNPVDNNAAGGSLRAMMGVDDLSFSATVIIPEPTSYCALLGALSLGLASWLRRRRGPASNMKS